jgi:hypothetical protein
MKRLHNIKTNRAITSITPIFTSMGGGPDGPAGVTLCMRLASTTAGKSMF